MKDSVRVGVQLWPGGTPDYRTWREAVVNAEELGADAIFGYDHFHKPFTVPSEDGLPELLPEQPDVPNLWLNSTIRAKTDPLRCGRRGARSRHGAATATRSRTRSAPSDTLNPGPLISGRTHCLFL